jgi:hypothetical protein
MGEIGINSYMKAAYEEFHALRRRKNKANSNPIKANLLMTQEIAAAVWAW